MSEPIRILQMMASLDRGGAETVVMDWLRLMDRERVMFDFVVNDRVDRYAYEDEAVALGARVVRAPRFKGWNAVPYAVWWWRHLKAHPEWRVVHAHYTTPAFVVLPIATMLGRATIAHSHTAGRDGSVMARLKVALRWPLRHVAQYRLACSKLAARWMFGSRKLVEVVPNGVEMTRFDYSEHERARSRVELGLQEAVVVGHVGRFNPPKNHSRILSVFTEVVAREPRARLVLVGDGPERGAIEQAVSTRSLDAKVILLGVRQDVPALMSAMDVLLFPSLYEGFPVTLVEAQASGLPCVVSDGVTGEAGLTDLVRFLPLSASNSVWADAVLNAAGSAPRAPRGEELRRAGFDAEHVANEMQDRYLAIVASQGRAGR